jgi:hypothetical protein
MNDEFQMLKDERIPKPETRKTGAAVGIRGSDMGFPLSFVIRH